MGSKTSLNTKRLSAMLGSFQDLGGTDSLMGLPDPSGLVSGKPEDENKSGLKAPSAHFRSSETMYSVGNMSGYSNYSGVIQEGIEVSYVVNKQETPRLPGLPGTKTPVVITTIQTDSVNTETINNDNNENNENANEKEGKEDEEGKDKKLIEIEDPKFDYPEVNRSNSKSSVRSNPLPVRNINESPKRRFNSLRASPSIKTKNGFTKIIQNEEETGLGDDQVTSQNPIISVSHHNESTPTLNTSQAEFDGDSISVTSSFVQELPTTVGRVNSGKEPVRSETTAFNPPIPPRNSNRPRSRIFIPEKVDEEEPINENISSTNLTPPHDDASKRISSVSTEDIDYGNRPLPNTPLQSTPDIIHETDKQIQVNGHIEEIKPKNHPLVGKGIGDFDIDALISVLQMTEGSSGSEFENLGMKVEGKKALEGLVDSLSKLVADMALDPEHHEEGLKRLKKATLELKGF
ncbi:hypothetical protein Kpol_1032p21 [Vanderwaltozyma polyspora DSM 70294]|uniref:Protein NBA1 n=1 Tax=Vanderwaltozyma polyspora (strain ATCC 22028 / DSM 70294 / BCRC 21397 / CBS 2163 / NBRC 10782 / NRRL Y-8283 / UCD 57-17) TaxID=436907 RepID=A7TGX6_VANPO|nr:uncharacterized protein Kpol_1032p21 [Vanderwaltozyma polyspora DSM 70294]EDO18428.1 hypothetical protein Kpol_1032p21 [Vanderwaltozyma polyspora DSM 70294]